MNLIVCWIFLDRYPYCKSCISIIYIYISICMFIHTQVYHIITQHTHISIYTPVPTNLKLTAPPTSWGSWRFIYAQGCSSGKFLESGPRVVLCRWGRKFRKGKSKRPSDVGDPQRYSWYLLIPSFFDKNFMTYTLPPLGKSVQYSASGHFRVFQVGKSCFGSCIAVKSQQSKQEIPMKHVPGV